MPEWLLAGPFVALLVSAAVAFGISLSVGREQASIRQWSVRATAVLLGMAVAWPMLLFVLAPIGPD